MPDRPGGSGGNADIGLVASERLLFRQNSLNRKPVAATGPLNDLTPGCDVHAGGGSWMNGSDYRSS